MKHQLPVPPARVWEKIEKILDQQDEIKRNTPNGISASFFKKTVSFGKRRFLVTAAFITGIAGLIILSK